MKYKEIKNKLKGLVPEILMRESGKSTFLKFQINEINMAGLKQG
jgi:pimeloyl-CoA synthetase